MKRLAFAFLLLSLLAACGNPLPQQTALPSQPPVLQVTPLPLTDTPFVPSPTPGSPAPLPESSPTPGEPQRELPQITPQALAPLPAGTKLSFERLSMFSETAGWALGAGDAAANRVFTTTDGGLTWTEVTPPEPRLSAGPALVASAAVLSPRQALVVYENASLEGGVAALHDTPLVVWRTQDGGATWQPSQALDLTGLDEIFNGLTLEWADAQHAWLLAHVGVGMNHDYITLYSTQDGGATWQRLLDPYGLSGIQGCYKTGMDFVNADEGWLTGTCNGVAAGTWFYRTLDGGSTWQPVELPEPQPGMFADFAQACATEYPNFFQGVDGRSDTGYLVLNCLNMETSAKTSYLYNTQNGGESWVIKDYPGGELHFVDTQHGWALGSSVYATNNGGLDFDLRSTVTWQAHFTFAGQDLVWAAARSEKGDLALVRSQNGGRRWELLVPLAR